SLPAHAIPGELIRKKPRTHMDVDAWIIEIRFLDAMSSEPSQVRTVDLHEADVVCARRAAMRVVDSSGIEARFDSRHRIEELRRDAVALRRFIPARKSNTAYKEQREHRCCSNTTHGSPPPKLEPSPRPRHSEADEERPRLRSGSVW